MISGVLNLRPVSRFSHSVEHDEQTDEHTAMEPHQGTSTFKHWLLSTYEYMYIVLHVEGLPA